MDKKQLRKKLGAKRYAEVVRLVKKLHAEGKSPDDIAKALRSTFRDLTVDPPSAVIVVI